MKALTKTQIKQLTKRAQFCINIMTASPEIVLREGVIGWDLIFSYPLDECNFGNFADSRSLNTLCSDVKKILKLGKGAGKGMWIGIQDERMLFWMAVA